MFDEALIVFACVDAQNEQLFRPAELEMGVLNSLPSDVLTVLGRTIEKFIGWSGDDYDYEQIVAAAKNSAASNGN